MFINPFLRVLASFYSCLIRLGSHLQSFLLLLLRLTWGHQFYIHGKAKLVDPSTFAALLTSLGFHHPAFCVILVGLTELIGGLLLLIGLGSRLAAIPLIVTMVVALGTAHAHIFAHFHFVSDPSLLVKEAPFPFLLTAVLVFIFGPGRFSLDAWIKRRSEHWERF